MPRKPPRSSEERLARTQKSMTPGTLGGRVASAAPMALDATRLDPRLRTQKRPLGSGFDPNADPVVIGDGAASTAAYSVTVGHGSHGYGASSVAIGDEATASGDYSIAIGETAEADGVSSVTLNGYAPADGSVALGGNARATATSAASLGQSAGANAASSVAIGTGSLVAAGHTHSSAVGAGATTTKAHQIMLGTASDFVEIPGDSSTAPNGWVQTDTATGTRYIVQITSGALVLNAAP